MFLKFKNDDERRECGGSAFIELQYCRLDKGSSVKKLFKTKNLPMWNCKDALFIRFEDMDVFAEQYRDLFGEAVYESGAEGLFDDCGVNYFSPEGIEGIISRISDAMPTEYEVILEWLETAKKFNGFYILGL